MRSLLIASLIAAACGPKTGPVSPASVNQTTRPALAPLMATSGRVAAPHPVLTIHQGQCQGDCPVYTVTLWSDGAIDRDGDLYVARKGAAHATIPLEQVARIEKAMADARYFDLDESGDLPVPVTCVQQQDGAETCSEVDDHAACVDTPNTTVTYVHGDRARTMFDAHCQETALSRLEGVILSILPLDGWITGEARSP